MCELTLRACRACPAPAAPHLYPFELYWTDIYGYTGSTSIFVADRAAAKAHFDFHFGRHGFTLREIARA